MVTFVAGDYSQFDTNGSTGVFSINKKGSLVSRTAHWGIRTLNMSKSMETSRVTVVIDERWRILS